MTREKSVLDIPSYRVLGFGVHAVDMPTALRACDALIRSGRPSMVLTADASALVIASEDAEFAEILSSGDLVTPDSEGVVWALRRAGCPQPTRVTGCDLMGELCSLSADQGYRIFLLGAEPGTAELAAEKLRLRYPGVHIVGTRHGYFPASDDAVVAQEIAESKPDILFVAMGIPRQEKFLRQNAERIGYRLGMGVGGSFDVYSGRVKRAPRLIRALKLEWLWRTLSNPKKFAKAKTLPVFAWRVLRSKRDASRRGS